MNEPEIIVYVDGSPYCKTQSEMAVAKRVYLNLKELFNICSIHYVMGKGVYVKTRGKK